MYVLNFAQVELFKMRTLAESALFLNESSAFVERIGTVSHFNYAEHRMDSLISFHVRDTSFSHKPSSAKRVVP